MELYDALKKVVGLQTEDILKDVKLINVLSDFKAFEKAPASKYILRDIITEGVIERLSEDRNQEDIELFTKSFSSDISKKYGYIYSLVCYVLDCIAYALELTSKIPTINPLSSNDILEMKNKRHLSFKRISFSEDIEEFVKKLEKSGFTQDDINKSFFYGRLNQEGELFACMKGTFAGVCGCDIHISSRRHSHSVSSVTVFFPYDEPIKIGEWEYIKKRYHNIKKRLTNKYGLPLQTCEEIFRPPKLRGFMNDMGENECLFDLENGTIRLSWSAMLYEDKINTELDEKDDIADL